MCRTARPVDARAAGRADGTSDAEQLATDEPDDMPARREPRPHGIAGVGLLFEGLFGRFRR